MKPLRRSLTFFVSLLVILSATNPVAAQTPAPGKPLVVYFFWGDGCPHCAIAKPYFEALPARFPGVVLRSYEVYYNQDNQRLFTEIAAKAGIQQFAVPTFFIGPYYLQGYAEELNPSIELVIQQCLQTGCIDIGEGFNLPAQSPSKPPVSFQATPTRVPAATATPQQVKSTPAPTHQSVSLNQPGKLSLPLIGEVNLDQQSVTLSTILIALVDGFNPCSLWVLSMLLALTLHTGSRRKVLLIGVIFLTVTAAIYALFIAGLFSVLRLASFMGWIQVAVALVALFFAVVNIKDYFWFKEGISFTIADEKRTGIIRRIRSVMDASQSFGGLVGATVALAAGVSLVEFSCTAGFPVVWVNLLNAQQVAGVSFVLLLLLYMLIYQLDELVIFFSAVVSLRASRMEEKHGRILKLIGGMLMLTLSIVMLIDPALMNKLDSSLIIFGVAFLATCLVLVIHRLLLPKFGIRIGSEWR